MKGRNAAKAFAETRGARFAAARAERDTRHAAERAAGTRRRILMVDPSEVREGDEVATRSGFRPLEDTDPSEWVVVNGQTAVQRFAVE